MENKDSCHDYGYLPDAVWLPHDVSKGTLHSVYDTGLSVAVPYPVFLFCSENDPVRKGAIK